MSDVFEENAQCCISLQDVGPDSRQRRTRGAAMAAQTAGPIHPEHLGKELSHTHPLPPFVVPLLR